MGGFDYVAVMLDAWSRRVVGFAISRSVDARLALAARTATIGARQPPLGCAHHSNRGQQYAATSYREQLAANALVGSLDRRDNPYHNAKAESLMKTLTIEAVYPMALETFANVAENLLGCINEVNNQRGLQSTLGYLRPTGLENQHTRRMVKPAA